MHRIADILTHSELQLWGSSSKSTRDIGGETELPEFRARTAGAAPSQTEEAIVPLLFPPPI